MYQLKVNKQPKIVKATKAFKTNKDYSLYEAERQYQAIFKAEPFKTNPDMVDQNDMKLDITISTNQKGKDGQNEYEMDVPISNYDSLSELVSLEMQRYLSSVSDNEARVIQRDAEVIAKEFLTPTETTRSAQHEGQSLMTRWKKRRLERQKMADTDNKEATEVQSKDNHSQCTKLGPDPKEEPIQTCSSDELSPLDTVEESSGQEEIKIEEASIPIPANESKNKDQRQGKLTVRHYKGASSESGLSSPVKAQPQLMEEAQYIELLKQDPAILEAQEKVRQPVEEALHQGAQFVIQKMAIQPTDSERVIELKKQYIHQNYHSDPLNKIKAQLDTLIQDNVIKTSQMLQSEYQKILGDKGKAKLDQAIQSKTAELETQYQKEVEEDVNRLADHQKLETQRMNQRHAEEKASLESRHQQESLDLTERQTKEMNQLVEHRQYNFTNRKQEALDGLKEQCHEEWVTQTNQSLEIELDTIRKQMISKIQMMGVTGMDSMKKYIHSWQHCLQEEQPNFEEAERRLIEEEKQRRLQQEQEAEKEAQRRKEAEEKAERDRQLQLEEEKIALQHKQIEVEQQKNEKTVIEKDTTIKELQSQLQEMKEELKQAQEQLHEERIERIQDKSRFNETIELQQRNFEFEQQKQQNTVQEPRQTWTPKQKKQFLMASTILVLGVGVGGIGWKAHQNAVADQAKQAEIQKEQERKQSDLEKSLKETQDSLKSVKDENKQLSQKNKDLESKKDSSDSKDTK